MVELELMRRLVCAPCFVLAALLLGSCSGSSSEGGAAASGGAGSGGSGSGGTSSGGNSGRTGTTGAGGTSGGAGPAGTGGSSSGGGGASGSSGTAGNGGTSGGSAGSGGATGGSSGSGGKTCEELRIDVNDALVKAKTCCPLCKSIQCTAAVSGLCCPETVNTPDSAETRAYLQALDAYQAARCVTACTLALCVQAPSNTCQPAGTCL